MSGDLKCGKIPPLKKGDSPTGIPPFEKGGA